MYVHSSKEDISSPRVEKEKEILAPSSAPSFPRASRRSFPSSNEDTRHDEKEKEKNRTEKEEEESLKSQSSNHKHLASSSSSSTSASPSSSREEEEEEDGGVVSEEGDSFLEEELSRIDDLLSIEPSCKAAKQSK